MIYEVELIIMNKDGVRDPEGETIQRYVVEKIVGNAVKGTRAGKYLLFRVDSRSPEEAVGIVRKLADEGRFYNPMAHRVIIRVVGREDCGH